MKKNLRSDLSRAQMKLDILRAKYTHWHPADRTTLDAMQKSIDEMGQRIALAENPIMQKWIKYCLRAIEQINHVLLNDKECSTEERRILMEKREMLNASIEVFVPKERAIAAIQREAEEYINARPSRAPMPGYPQNTVQRYGTEGA